MKLLWNHNKKIILCTGLYINKSEEIYGIKNSLPGPFSKREGDRSKLVLLYPASLREGDNSGFEKLVLDKKRN